jgi:hypothetical protein
MAIELGDYGFMFDTDWAYVAISWQLLIIGAVSLVAYKVYKWKRGK